LKEIIEIFSRFSEEIKEWQDNWYRKYAGQHINVTAFKNLWELFAASINATGDFVERIDESIESLNDARRSIPKPDKKQSLKFKIKEAGAEVEKLKQDLEQLTDEQEKLTKKLTRFSSMSPSSESKRINLETRANQDLTKTNKLIESTRNLLNKQTLIFNKKKVKLFKESKDDEIKLCQILKEQSNVFVKALKIESKNFLDIFQKCEPQNELNQWEDEYFLRNTKQLDRSQTNDNETSNKIHKHPKNLSTTDHNEDS
jgi:hypothetical protein